MPAAAGLGETPSADHLFERLRNSLRALTDPENDRFPPVGSRGRTFAWYWGYWGRALVYLYEATREPRFLALFRDAFDVIDQQRDDRMGTLDHPQRRIVPGWGTEIDGVHANEVTVAGLVTLPLCEFLLLLRRDATAAARHEDVGARYLALAEEVVSQYEADYRLVDAGGYYLHPVTGTVEPLNHTHALAAACVHLWALTMNGFYRQKVEEISAYYRASMAREENGSVSWPYAPTPDRMSGLRAERIWKAGTTIELPVAAYRHGIVFSDDDAIRFSRTLTRNILRPNGINEYITSRRTALLGRAAAGTSRAGGGVALWFQMPDPEARHREAIFKRTRAQPELFPSGWFGGARSMVMALAWLLREDAARVRGAPS